MNALTLLYWALSGFVLSAVLAGVFYKAKAVSGFLAGLGGAVSSALALGAGVQALMSGATGEMGLRFFHQTLQLTPMNGLWLIAVCLPALFVSLFNISWHQHAGVKANGLLINLLLAAAVMALTAGNIATLVLMAEIMALCAAFLTGCAQSGKLWFALGRLGTVLLVIACLLLEKRYGTLDYAALHEATALQPLGSGIWLLGLVGFGLLAGIIPLHGWVPQAHANASAPAAALFSAVVLKVGLFGILTFSLIDAALPLWWGIVVMVLGMLTAFIGGLYALMEHNINRLLAYHSLENIGIILLGLGAGLTGLSLNEPGLIALGLTGGLFHLVNHSLFKSTLFLGAGAVWFRTGYRDIEKLGGIGKRMPLISLAMLVGLMSMAALPPLNGFAGEWVIYQSFFRLGEQPLFAARLLGPLLAVGLAITGALAVMCMAKVYGVTFLGAPRTREASEAKPAPLLMNLSVAALALCCVASGVAAPWILPLLRNVVPLPLVSAHSVVSQPLMTLLLIGCPLLPFLVMVFFKGDRLVSRSRGAAWVCGYDHEQSMVITATGFAQPVKAAFAPLLNLRNRLNPVQWVPGWQSECLAGSVRRLAFIELAILLVIVVSRGA
ncbi:formate hydrogenlyase subunit 3 [Shimwellia blattae DSM 4481 = NBRC 105725]|uniref:Formate hydrogenlyase subunit 3 n=1 Tax=Shimwellia blattae (strain ATCC 29907 / DSM 4481 / JCM 1650 / NBRC 105725 / CDC 9005-74) TaxID=630626 RepID=I2B3Y5_SHIBC|nr:formate hydrogenlyase subunit 3 [Shimwellia blattae]AFJ45239.1 formate hydrogenlyase subunit 3 [Shimwellia blattae DSM 4481 = NBRC 105725]GAB80647.1 formate hydrogen lyase membrane subunit HycC [Shimwellia blattae DSM 4481 = NBRC 105725]VEC19500.1 Hydrogenase-4 component B [Shimwellia blattae]